ncbi:centlein-like [Styela clava]
MDAFIKAKDDEIVKLLADNRELSEELRQCQADKEFVWSLWKRLQVSSPDLTQAISLVMQREKEKCETKDRKVLEILQSKDEQIENLQDTVTSLKKEVDKLVQMKSSLEETRSLLTTENEELKRNNDVLNERMARIEAVGKDHSVGLKKSVEDLKEQRDSLNDKVTKLLIDLQTARMESQTNEAENEKLKRKCKSLEEDNGERMTKCQKLQAERESLSEEVLKLKTDLSHYRDGEDSARRELDSKSQSHFEIKQSYEQLKSRTEEQKSIILQLQSLNNDAQSVLKDQEKAYKEELSKSHKIYSELARKYESLQKSYHNLERVHEDLKENAETLGITSRKTGKDNWKRALAMASGHRRRRTTNVDEVDDLEVHVASQQDEIDVLRRRLKEKTVQLAEMKNSDYFPVRDNGKFLSEHTFSPIIERRGRDKELPSQRSARSLSPNGRQMSFVNRRLQATEEKLDSTKRLLDLKKEELKQLQKAHDKRLGRLKEVQAHYRELKETLSEKDVLSPRKSKSKKKTKRPNIMDMRQEDCDAVWNELAYYKRENRNLIHEKLSLEEDLDNLRVQAAMDKATVQELNMCLKQEKDDLMTKLRNNMNGNRLSSTPKKRETSPDKAGSPVSFLNTTLRHIVKNLERKLENATEDTRLLKKEKSQLLKDIRVIKEENKSLKRDVTDSRQSSANLRRDIVELRHKVELAEDKKLEAEFEAKNKLKEAANERASNIESREEINALRAENNDLRAELTDLKAELREITNSLEAAEVEATSRTQTSARNTIPSLSARTSSTKLSTDSARKHQKFLNNSIRNMREAFGKESTVDSENDSDSASLGERIVRAARSVPGLTDSQASDDDDDTLTKDDVPDLRPVSSKLPKRTKSSSKYGVNDLTSLRQRLSSMQRQCSTLITERQNALKEVSDEKDKNTLLESEIQGVQNRLKSAKASIQKLHREVEVISREKEELQRNLESVKNSMPEPQKHSDTDYRLLENKLRMANADAHHYMDQMKKLQKENEEKIETVTGMKEKLTRLERDITMKRQLIEEQRAKIKAAEQSNQTEQETMSELEAQIRQLSEELSHKKNYIDSLKKQVQAVGRDKARYEQSYNETKSELEKRREQVSVEQARKLEAENLASQLENTVEQQLNTLASKSEQALEKMQTQLSISQEKNREYSTCIQILSSQLLDHLSHIRNTIYNQKQTARQEAQIMRESDPSMSRAQSIACSILNMSKADFEELMTPVDSKKRDEEEQNKSDEKRLDRDWKMKVEEIAAETPPFAKSLNRLLWDKIQDAIHMAEEKCRLQYEIAAEKT